jgi:hypothetical protein
LWASTLRSSPLRPSALGASILRTSITKISPLRSSSLAGIASSELRRGPVASWRGPVASWRGPVASRRLRLQPAFFAPGSMGLAFFGARVVYAIDSRRGSVFSRHGFPVARLLPSIAAMLS